MKWRFVAAFFALPLLASCAFAAPSDGRKAVHVAEADMVGVWQDSRGGELRLDADGKFSAKRILLVGGRDDLEGAPEWPGSAGSWVRYEDSESSGVLLLLEPGSTATFETVSKDGEILLSNWVDEGVYYEFVRADSKAARGSGPSVR